MAIRWTPDQRRVIETRNSNILVSAAAGSGKTAVLVERIISMVCGDLDGEEPVDVDRLLVVTFTKAAAAEMRERVGLSLEKRLSEDPENIHLQRQQTLIHNAQITTIDSFCQYVVRSYFHRIDVDPSFRIGDEGELKLLRGDVMNELLERHYAAEDGEEKKRFTEFVESYAPGRSDAPVTEMIDELYRFAVSYPDPKQWLDGCARLYRASDITDIENSGWMKYLLGYVHGIISDLKKENARLIETAKEPDGPYMYLDALTDDRLFLETLSECGEYGRLKEALDGHTFRSLSTKRDSSVSADKRAEVKSGRDAVKKTLAGLRDRYFSSTPEEVLEEIGKAAPATEELVSLTAEFMDDYDRKKKDRNLADFQDVEFMALKILAESFEIMPDGTVRTVPTDAAKELASKYVQIMTDEYQDSNLIQETLLNAVAYGQGVPNLFMVGDVKQSIYSFRKARPGLFMDKYRLYREPGSKAGTLISLSTNFRSRETVTSAVNYLFEKLMSEGVGGIEYGPSQALYPGADYPENGNEDCRPELLIVEKDNPEGDGRDGDMTAVELEAKAAADRIRRMAGNETVWDAKDGAYVPVRYKDIVILMRSTAGRGETFARVLNSEGIPAHTESGTGYFDTMEVQTVLNLLRVVDNPRQDIPLAAVMKSMIGGFTDEELAVIKSAYRDITFHEACMKYSKREEGDDIAEKLSAFYGKINGYRRRASRSDIHEFIEYVFEDTGYADYIAACPGGSRRTANIRMLVQKAVAFEKTSYRGIFNFVRYIEKLRKYEEDFGEAGVFGENEDAVRIMTIHKSKGLEFPVVIVAGLGKNFNRTDIRSRVVMHPEMGIGVDRVDLRLRTKKATLPKRVLQKCADLDMLGEEQRILYVAVTRAREKLILLGSTDKLDSKLQKYRTGKDNEKLSCLTVSEASSYLDWILEAAADRPDSPFRFSRVTYEDEAVSAVCRQLDLDAVKAAFKNPGELPVDTGYSEAVEKNLSYVYPWEGSKDLPVKLSVSELKRSRLEDEAADEAALLYAPEEPVPYIPRFMREDEASKLSGAERGTAYHCVMQYLDFDRVTDLESVKSELSRLETEGRLTGAQARAVRAADILRFARSPLASRMKAAGERGTLRAEQPFVIAIGAEEALPGSKAGEDVLVQGIIDAYFTETGADGAEETVLVDYKTDYVHEARQLIQRYRSQLEYYAAALERLTGHRVKEKLIYSFCLGTQINL